MTLTVVDFPKQEEGPDESLIEMVEELLERVKDGRAQDIVVIGYSEDDDPFVMIGTDWRTALTLVATAFKEI